MEININDYVSFNQIKNGKYKVEHDESKRKNVFKLLVDLGFGCIKQNSRRIYFKKEQSAINPVRFGDFQKTFLQAIKYCDSQLPANVSMLDVFKYFRKYPINRDDIFTRYLDNNLSEVELEEFAAKNKLKIDKSQFRLKR